MSLRDICNLAVHDPIHGAGVAGHQLYQDAFLFLWTTNSFLVEGKAQRVCEAWGFKPKQLITWVKTKKPHSADEHCPACPHDCEHCGRTLERAEPSLEPKDLQFGMGFYTRGVTEHIILATRGQCTDMVKDHSIRNTIFAPRRKHSRKPDRQYELIETLVPGPYLELFATQRREGWTSWGIGLGG
jgi:N6-adenosine-specific RNA methylase IME4